ncbi:putative protease [Arcticibacter tournemirensis]|uniref:U32 family peptidase n=1 Tax=Arcticibacter tournemirensis TaxID=699437 RepID=A0A5M9HJ63_9SPHI|nr:peptidase U32 family protein [Arcticibacter tournemirensis]KAA8485448.1 U32 family peptidase [Arcticibacter tournemirensis]TQM48850.1 putative protease [Arcticibacter tournemirensis]
MQNSKVELMAPAGSFESLMAAIKAGADSVYFGIEQLNMRARSSNNFTIDDLAKITAICKEHNIRAYLTLNTILYDHDISLMRSIIDAAKKHGVDAVIATDFSVLHYAKKVGLNVHISTQANITNIETVEFFADYADVMVMARELSLMQVGAITREIKRRNITGPSGELVQIEVFAHGALCMAVSGKCYMSLHSDFASANRGACIQNCRRSYIVTDKDQGVEFEIDNEYIMSAKDLCTIDFLDKMMDAGIKVLKIEGRGRSADYVYTVIKCYKEAIGAYFDGTYTNERIEEWKTRLSTVFNRGFWDGYYLGRKMGEWSNVYGSKATRRKVYLGKGVKYFDNVRIGEFRMESQSLDIGDEILITGPTTGIVQTTVSELRVNDRPTGRVKKGDVFSMLLDEKVRPSDKLYKLVDA